MWPFSYFKKKKEEALEKKRQEELRQLQLRKEKYNRYKEYIDSVVFQFNSEEENKRTEYIDKVREENKIHNQTCPNCKSKNIIQVFRRPKGELHGSLNGYSSYSSGLFAFHSSHRSSGKIDANLDTLKVNQCKECGQEWEHKDENKMVYYSSDWYFGKCDRYENVPSFLRRVWHLIEDIENYNPNKLDNPCNSIQEFIEMKKGEICKYWGRGVLDLSMEVLHYYARCNSFSLIYGEILEKYTKDDGGILYLGKFTPKMEDFLINEFGFKYHFNE